MSNQNNTAASRIKSLLGKFKERFMRLSLRNRIGLLAGIPLVITVAVVALMWVQEPSYKTLFTNLRSESDAAPIIAELEKQNIPHKISQEGTVTTISVPSDVVYKTRLSLAQQGLMGGASEGWKVTDRSNFGITVNQEFLLFIRAISGELENSIRTIPNVADVRILIADPSRRGIASPILRPDPPTGSVNITTNNGSALSEAVIEGITNLVSASYPGLTVENVRVVVNGSLAKLPKSFDGVGVNPQHLEFQQQLEQYYLSKVNSLLDKVASQFGYDAQVTLGIDFSDESLKINNNSPEGGGLISRMINEGFDSNCFNAMSGVPGMLTNTPPGNATAPINPDPNAPTNPAPNAQPTEADQQRIAILIDKCRTRSETVNNNPNEVVRNIKRAVGRITDISVAVLLNDRSEINKDSGNPVNVAWTQTELDKIADIIRASLGANISPQALGDVGFQVDGSRPTSTVLVSNIPFSLSADTSKNISFFDSEEFPDFALRTGLIIIVALALLYLIFGVIRPAVRQLINPPTPTDLAADGDGFMDPLLAGAAADPRNDPLEMAKAIARENPQVVAMVIRQWMTGDSPASESPLEREAPIGRQE